MAMYFQSNTEIQGDGLHTLYLMNPNYADTLFNPSSAAAAVMLHAPPHCMNIPPQIPVAVEQSPITWNVDDRSQQTPRGLALSLSAHHKSVISNDQNPPLRQPPETNNGNSVIMGSKYLKAAQELLDEVVNVGNEARKDKGKVVKDSSTVERQTAIKTELTTAQRQENQMKISKLKIMLDEVDQRCRQYHQHMQIVMATFEQAAGSGSARAYTHLALKTILRQFRCLKSTISAQIKTLGDEENLSLDKNKFEGSRLKLVDSQFRQQRALQQIGMNQNNAWRPQRGLPERAVSVLRAWLFEHFLHPYPKDSDKQMLAKQTGLTRSQVSNWFINARVRLWKPMVEEMYLEETKNQHQIPPNKPPIAAPSPPPEISPSTLTTSSTSSSLSLQKNFAHLITSLNMDNMHPQNNLKKPRNNESTMADDPAKFSTENYLPIEAANVIRGNNFSLSLGLHPTQSSQQFLSHRSFVQGDGGGYEILDYQKRKQFPTQLLPDFVA